MKKTVMRDGGKKLSKYPEICFPSDSEEKSSIKNSELQTCRKIGFIRSVCDHVNNTEFGRIVLYFFSTNFEEWW
jgi:hypothetical protein